MVLKGHAEASTLPAHLAKYQCPSRSNPRTKGAMRRVSGEARLIPLSALSGTQVTPPPLLVRSASGHVDNQAEAQRAPFA